MSSYKNTYWIPLLEYSNKKDKIIWSGKALPLPLDQTVKKEPLKLGLGLTSSVYIPNQKNGLFVTVGSKKYLLGVKNIFKSPGFKFGNKELLKNEENVQLLLKTTINKSFTKKKLKAQKTGMQLKITGRLSGVNKTTRVVVSTGSFRPQSFDSKLDFSYCDIFTKWGVLGLKVYIN